MRLLTTLCITHFSPLSSLEGMCFRNEFNVMRVFAHWNIIVWSHRRKSVEVCLCFNFHNAYCVLQFPLSSHSVLLAINQHSCSCITGNIACQHNPESVAFWSAWMHNGNRSSCGTGQAANPVAARAMHASNMKMHLLRQKFYLQMLGLMNPELKKNLGFPSKNHNGLYAWWVCCNLGALPYFKSF